MTDTRRRAGEDTRPQGPLIAPISVGPPAAHPVGGCSVAGGAMPQLRAAARLVARPLAIYLASRVVVLGAIAAVSQLGLGRARHHFPGPWPSIAAKVPFLRALSTWDASWYLHVATNGYGSVHRKFAVAHHLQVTPDMAFLPLFPLTVRAGHVVTGLTPAAVGAVLVFLLGAVAAVMVWALARRLTDRRVADRAVALWCFFPGAFVLSLIYTEGLTVACAAACLLALLGRRWALAGVAAALATATQPSALVLIPCCAWAAWLAVRRHREWGALVAPALAPLGALAYVGYLWARTGEPAAWYHVQHKYWHGQLNPYATTVSMVYRTIVHPGTLNYLVPTLGLVLVVIGAVLLRHWRPPAVVWIYAAGVMALALLSAPVGARPRFFLVAFPLAIATARIVKGRAFVILLGSSAVLLVAVTLVTTTTLKLTP